MKIKGNWNLYNSTVNLFIFGLMFFSFNSDAETIAGRFFDGQEYAGNYFIGNLRNSDGMVTHPITINLHMAEGGRSLNYVYDAEDYPLIEGGNIGFLSIIVKSGGMEGSTSYNYIVPSDGGLISIGEVKFSLNLGKVEAVDVARNKKLSEKSINYYVSSILKYNLDALLDKRNSYNVAAILYLGQGQYIDGGVRRKLAQLCRNSEIIGDRMLSRDIRSVVGVGDCASTNDGGELRKNIVVDRAYFFDFPSSGCIKKSYLIKGDVVTVLKMSDDGSYWLVDYISPSYREVKKWLRCQDIAYCK